MKGLALSMNARAASGPCFFLMSLMSGCADDVFIDLALQGGGAHGAFTWGVLDRLLEEPKLGIDGISGTSAGAMNAGHGSAPIGVIKTSILPNRSS
jgi:predicted acylesterase/phospholipase RssA